MKRSFPVIDADGHILERDRELREFLPPQFRAVPGKREYPLFSWDGWARGALSPAKREYPSVELVAALSRRDGDRADGALSQRRIEHRPAARSRLGGGIGARLQRLAAS